MTTDNNIIVPLSIEELLNGNDSYSIPIYQRNYAWEEGEITQLIQDIIDYIPQPGEVAKNYYLGTLIVYEKIDGQSFLFETIDGQQRLTTLSILTAVFRHNYPEISLPWFKKINLEFESRKYSSNTLKSIFNNFYPNNINYNESILNGYQLCEKLLKLKIVENNIEINHFSDFLFKSVKILRVPVPDDTDLNHYFEIMNSRGEQLEKHEILKSTFLEVLNELDESEKQIASECFHLIWEACSNMEKYVQYGFTTNQRDALFGKNDWNSFSAKDFYEISEKLKTSLNTSINSSDILSLSDIIEGKTIKIEIANEDETPDRFNSVINFQNFLLHVLRVQTREDIPLDDKRLIKSFENQLQKSEDKIEFTKLFAFNLLRCKFLFDKYILKREFLSGIDRWSLKKLRCYEGNKVSYVNTFGIENNENENKHILMLLSMFHVSTPTMVYKYWLNSALFYITYQNDEIISSEYINFLESTAKAFIFDRYLFSREPLGYYDITYKSRGTIKRNIKDLNLEKLSFGKIENNLIFNYLDYLLWQDYKDKNSKILNFKYTFRSSVEHYYPQHPMSGFPVLEEKFLHSFGNLCLISHSKNSRLSNQPPSAKKSYYAKNEIDSIKQEIMISEYHPDEWNEGSINDHNLKMIELLTKEIDSKSTFDYTYIGANYTHTQSKAMNWFNANKIENKVLLARALMCFGDIAYDTKSSTGGGEKWNLFQWDYILTTEAFAKFKEFVEINNPSSLKSIIDYNLSNNVVLKNDWYRLIFIQQPEIIEYCNEGNFGWINDGNKVLLLSGKKISNDSRDMYIHLLSVFIESKLMKEPYVEQDELSISLSFDQDEDKIYVENFDNNSRVFLNINIMDNELKFNITTYNLRLNSPFAERLSELGWAKNEDGYYIRNDKYSLLKIGENYVENYQNMIAAFIRLLKSGLGIKFL